MIPQSSGANPPRLADFFPLDDFAGLRTAARLVALNFGLAFTLYTLIENSGWSREAWLFVR